MLIFDVMKNILILLLISCSFAALQAQEEVVEIPDTTLNAKIELLMKLSGSEKMFTTAIDQMIDMQKKNPAYRDILPAEFWDDFSAETHATGYESLKPGMVALYKKYLTEEEIDHQIEYLGSPITQRIIAKQPELVQESMAIGAEWGKELGERIALKLQQAVEEERN